MKAIILAAGYGKRIKLNFPKCLINLDGKTVLDRLVTNLRSAGIEDISVVVGYENKQVKNQLVKQYFNDIWYNTEEFYSLYCAKDELNDDVIVLYGDLVVKKSAIKKIKEAEGNISVLCDKNGFCGVAKFSKEACEAIKGLKKNYNQDMQKAIVYLSMTKGYEVNKVGIESGKVFNIDTIKDLQYLKDNGIKIVL